MGLILKIDGVRHTMGQLKAGTYRQAILFGEDYKNCSDVELVEDALEIVRVAFDLTKEQAAQIDVDKIIPTFLQIQELAQRVFIEKAAEVPNEQGPADYPGQT